jgi:hypothetical protein
MPSCVRCVLQVSRTAEGSRPYHFKQSKPFGRWYYTTLKKFCPGRAVSPFRVPLSGTTRPGVMRTGTTAVSQLVTLVNPHNTDIRYQLPNGAWSDSFGSVLSPARNGAHALPRIRTYFQTVLGIAQWRSRRLLPPFFRTL